MDASLAERGASILREISEGNMTTTQDINQDAIYGLIIGSYLLIIALAIVIGILISKIIKLSKFVDDYKKEVDDLAMGRLKPEDPESNNIANK